MVSYSRNFKNRPEQFIKKLNDTERQRETEESSKWMFNIDGSQVIVLGQQPEPSTPGTFGIVLYDVFGDRLEINTVVL
jgi:hypothetical protein